MNARHSKAEQCLNLVRFFVVVLAAKCAPRQRATPAATPQKQRPTIASALLNAAVDHDVMRHLQSHAPHSPSVETIARAHHRCAALPLQTPCGHTALNNSAL